MTLADLEKKTLEILKKERTATEITDFTNADEGQDIRALINDGYEIVCLENYRPYKTKTITPTAGVFTLTTLLSGDSATISAALRILKVRNPNDESAYVVEAGENTDEYYVVGEPTSVKVTFEYMPIALSTDLAVPIFPTWAHDCLADYAASELLSRRGDGQIGRRDKHMYSFNEKRSRIKNTLETKKIPARTWA